MGITHPILDEQGGILGFVTLSLPHQVLQDLSTDADTSEPTQLIIFDREETILAARNGLEDAAQDLPEGRSLKALSGDEAVSFSALSVSGSMSIFSVVPLVPGELYALGRWPSTEAAGARSMFLPQYLSGPYLLPCLIWTASLIAAWLSVERLVNRHIRKLSRSIKSFAGGSRSVGNVNVAGAPLEVREMAEAYLSMTEIHPAR